MQSASYSTSQFRITTHNVKRLFALCSIEAWGYLRTAGYSVKEAEQTMRVGIAALV